MSDTAIIRMTSDEFHELFGDLVREPGAGNFVEVNVRDEAEIDRYLAENRLWTMVDTDVGRVYLINGFHFVNRIGTHLSERPYSTEQADRIEVLWAEETVDD